MALRSRFADRRCASLRSWLGTGAVIVALFCLSITGCTTIIRKNIQTKHQRTAAQSRLKYELALQHYKGGRTDTAIENVNEAISAHPSSPDQFLLLANCHIELGQFVSARDAAEKAGECDPESAEADYTLGVIAERTNDIDMALEHYRRARSRGRGAVDYVVAEAECLTAMGRFSQAISLISDQIDRFDSDGTLEMLLAQIYLLDGDRDDALRELGLAMERSACDAQRLRGSSGCALLIEEYGALLTEAGQYGHAIALLESFVELHDDAPPSIVAALATSYLETGRSSAALRLLVPQTKRHPESAVGWLLLARSAILASDWTTARQGADTLRRLVPDSSEAHLVRAFVCWKQNDRDEAVWSLRQSLAIEPHDAVAHCLIAQILEDGGRDTIAAQTHYERAFQIDPRYACAGRVFQIPQDDHHTSTAPPTFVGSSPLEATMP